MSVEDQPQYYLFGTAHGWIDSSANSSLQNIFSQYPADNACATNPDVAGTWSWKYQWQGQKEGQDTLLLKRSGIWLNQEIDEANGKWAIVGKTLTVEFKDPTFTYHNKWTGVLSVTNDSVNGTMIQYRASDNQQTATGTFQGTRLFK